MEIVQVLPVDEQESPMEPSGDLGRRIVERRHKLGMSAEQLAARSGVSPAYLHLLETSPSAQPSTACLLRLASALETTIDIIGGGGMTRPPGRGGPQKQTVLKELTAEECADLVAPGGIGRVVFCTSRGPVALPVNYQMLDGDIIFRTSDGSTLSEHNHDVDVSFEVDQIDDALTEGWSVLMTCFRKHVTSQEELDEIHAVEVTPWAGGTRDEFVRLVPVITTGRRIRCE
jgi:transcriptional regulator with XRE-family HTH domain